MKRQQLNNPAPNIGVDLLGSENSPKLLIESIFQLADELKSSVKFTLIGTEDLNTHFILLKEKYPHLSVLSFFAVKNCIAPEEDPLVAIRRKKDSSVCEGMKLLKNENIDALVSAGNTGALTTSAKLFLPMLPGIERPALLAVFPTKKNLLAVLDVGANISYKAENLVQFALVGICFQKNRGIQKPVVGLLNIGSEEKKGTKELRQTYKDLQKLSLLTNNFIFAGNIEGKQVFDGNIDVLVTDGFTGNVFLKTAEGIASFILDYLYSISPDKNSFHLRQSLFELEKNLHYSEYPGALMCGLEKIVIKCHSYSSPHAIINGLKGAISLVENNFIASIKAFLGNVT